MKLYLISHGDISNFESEKLAGRTDITLTENSKQQLNIIRKSGYYRNVDMVFTAPLKRCEESARIIYPNLITDIVSELNEYDYADFEGMPHEFLKNNEKYLKWLSTCGVFSHNSTSLKDNIPDSNVKNNNARGFENCMECESFENFYRRLRKSVYIICTKLESRNMKIGAIITTSNVIMHMISTMLNADESSSGSSFCGNFGSSPIDKYQFKLKPGNGFSVSLNKTFDFFETVSELNKIS